MDLAAISTSELSIRKSISLIMCTQQGGANEAAAACMLVPAVKIIKVAQTWSALTLELKARYKPPPHKKKVKKVNPEITCGLGSLLHMQGQLCSRQARVIPAHQRVFDVSAADVYRDRGSRCVAASVLCLLSATRHCFWGIWQAACRSVLMQTSLSYMVD